MRKVLALASLALVMGVGLACSQSTEASRDSESIKQEFDSFKESMNQRLEMVDKKIEELQESMKTKTSTAKDEMKEKISQLKNMRSEIDENMKDLADTSKDRYADFKLSVEHKVETLSNEVEKAFN